MTTGGGPQLNCQATLSTYQGMVTASYTPLSMRLARQGTRSHTTNFATNSCVRFSVSETIMKTSLQTARTLLENCRCLSSTTIMTLTHVTCFQVRFPMCLRVTWTCITFKITIENISESNFGHRDKVCNRSGPSYLLVGVTIIQLLSRSETTQELTNHQTVEPIMNRNQW